MSRNFTLKNINAAQGDKIVILGGAFQVMPWNYSKPLASALADKAQLGFVPSGTYTVISIKGETGQSREYEIQGPL